MSDSPPSTAPTACNDTNTQQSPPNTGGSTPITGPYSIEVGDLIFQGAESKVYHCSFYGQPAVYKHRFVKRYRNPTLDERLRSQRTRHEARALERCLRQGIRAPRLLATDIVNSFIVMTYEGGMTVKEALDIEHARAVTPSMISSASISPSPPPPVVAALLRGIGVIVAMLHNANMVHGDLTTSNFISTFPHNGKDADTLGGHDASGSAASSASVTKTATKTLAASASAAGPVLPTAQDLVVLDFGLISDKYSAEERAVDLYVLERAIASTHPYAALYASEVILEGYQSVADPKKEAETMKRLDAVRARGRKRTMVG